MYCLAGQTLMLIGALHTQCATTNSLGTTSQPCASLPPWHSGFSRARFPLLDNTACRHPDNDRETMKGRLE